MGLKCDHVPTHGNTLNTQILTQFTSCQMHIKRTEDFQVCLEYMRTMNSTEKCVVLNDKISYKLNKGIGKRFHGSYTPSRVFQIIALWADKKA